MNLSRLRRSAVLSTEFCTSRHHQPWHHQPWDGRSWERRAPARHPPTPTAQPRATRPNTRSRLPAPTNSKFEIRNSKSSSPPPHNRGKTAPTPVVASPRRQFRIPNSEFFSTPTAQPREKRPNTRSRLPAPTIPNSELRIFLHPHRTTAGNTPQHPWPPPRADNSEFRIPNSEFFFTSTAQPRATRPNTRGRLSAPTNSKFEIRNSKSTPPLPAIIILNPCGRANDHT